MASPSPQPPRWRVAMCSTRSVNLQPVLPSSAEAAISVISILPRRNQFWFGAFSARDDMSELLGGHHARAVWNYSRRDSDRQRCVYLGLFDNGSGHDDRLGL